MSLKQDAPDWRESPRWQVDYPITMTMGRARMPAHLVDVSQTGVRLSTRTSRIVGELYDIQIRVQGKTETFRIATRWDYFLDDHYITGAELVWVEESDRARWRDCIGRLPRAGTDFHREKEFEQRVAPRRPTRRPLLFLDRHQWVKGEFRNISEGGKGALLIVRALHAPEKVVRFKVRIEDTVYRFRAQSVWSRLVEGDYHLGIAFIEPVDEHDRPLPRRAKKQ